MKKEILCSLGVLACSGMIQAQDQVEPKITKMALFKNGQVFVEMSVTPVEGKKSLRLVNIPSPSRGTLWFESNGSSLIDLMSGKVVYSKQPKLQYSFAELALANPGAQVEITNNEGKTYSGIISLVNVNGSKKEEEEENASSPFLGLKTPGGYKFISPDDIANIEFMGIDELKLPMEKTGEAAIQLHFSKIDPKDPVRISYITNGMSWDQSYRFEMDGEGKGILKAQVEITNNLADVSNADLELVSGQPVIRFAGVPSAITMPSLRHLLGPGTRTAVNIQGTGNLRPMAKAKAADMILAKEESASFELGASALSPDDAVRAENLFFYPIKGYSSPKNECVLVPLFSKEIPYEHILTWNIGQTRPDFTATGPSAPQDVWHCIRLTNTLDIALTSSPIVFMSKDRFTGQANLPLTPPGEKSLIAINKSMDVVAQTKEKILSEEKIKINNREERMKYDIEGELTIKNISKKPVKMMVHKSVFGLVGECSDKGDISRSSYLPDRYNPHSSIKWEVTVEPGEEKKITYQYKWING